VETEGTPSGTAGEAPPDGTDTDPEPTITLGAAAIDGPIAVAVVIGAAANDGPIDVAVVTGATMEALAAAASWASGTRPGSEDTPDATLGTMGKVVCEDAGIATMDPSAWA